VPQESLFRAIVEIVFSVVDAVSGGFTSDYWRIVVSVLVALVVVVLIWCRPERNWVETTMMWVCGVGIPLLGIHWHRRSGD
jgi:hypothetical protein